MNKIYHIVRKNKVQEGGMARDIAFYRYFKNISKSIKLGNNRLINLIKLTIVMFFLSNKNILLHYPSLGIPISNNSIIKKMIVNWFLFFLKLATKKNNIIIDIADLPFEQAIDLNLSTSEEIKKFEKRLFSLDIKFIFASYEMKKYVCEKYSVPAKNTMVCINGGNELKNLNIKRYKRELAQNKINFVYAGTLNKGRQIEELINLFSDSKDINLILMGTKGEWINKSVSSKNIKYFGALDENIAHEIVSICDIGLIPYDSSRFYYNIAFPTKLSFYITAGIPYLSTDVKEVKKVNRDYNIGYTLNFKNWEEFINNIDSKRLLNKKEKIESQKDNFMWTNILKQVDSFLE